MVHMHMMYACHFYFPSCVLSSKVSPSGAEPFHLILDSKMSGISS